MDRRLLHTGSYGASPAGTEMGSPRKAGPESVGSHEELEDSRCRAVLGNGERCKREGQPVFDGRSGEYPCYCIAHRRLLREAGLLSPTGGQGARE